MVAYKTKQSQDEVSKTVEAFMAEIKQAVINGDSVTLRGFGTFSPKTRKEKIGQNITLGQSIVIPEHRIPHFKPSQEFKRSVK